MTDEVEGRKMSEWKEGRNKQMRKGTIQSIKKGLQHYRYNNKENDEARDDLINEEEGWRNAVIKVRKMAETQ